MSRVEDGAEAILQLAVSPALEGRSGLYFNVLREARADPQAYDAAARAAAARAQPRTQRAQRLRIVLIVTAFPAPCASSSTRLIPLKDGTMLAARIWLPEDAEQNPVPAILEYLPYRKRDGTYERDALTHPYLAGHGYAGVRVDIRGSGESDGLLFDEYAQQEQDDGVEVIAWLAAQPWCSGAVGMMGISWGGFNGLQIAARRPPALKAIVTICSTDDRYADDVHYMGGALLDGRALSWASFFFGSMCLRPTRCLSASAGGRCGWSAWRTCRCSSKSGCSTSGAMPIGGTARCARITRAIQCPVYAVGGWTDAYTNAIPRLLERLDGAAQGSDRAVGPRLSAFRASRPADRLPARDAALVGLLAEGYRYRRDG